MTLCALIDLPMERGPLARSLDARVRCVRCRACALGAAAVAASRATIGARASAIPLEDFPYTFSRATLLHAPCERFGRLITGISARANVPGLTMSGPRA